LLKKEFLPTDLSLRVQDRFKIILILSTLKVLLLVSASNGLRFLQVILHQFLLYRPFMAMEKFPGKIVFRIMQVNYRQVYFIKQ